MSLKHGWDRQCTLSATPGSYELEAAHGEVVEQVIRPTGLVDPKVIVKPTKGQIDDLLGEIRERTAKNERVLVTTLTKKMAEDLTDYLLERGVRVRYLHSDIDTLRRVELLRQLRLGSYDVLVGINLLREGLDLPEVSLVAILDADKEGFLRSRTSLIQTIGRAARNVSGEVHMYADSITDSMRDAIDETERRRAKQIAYNEEHGIDPQPLRKQITDILDELYDDLDENTETAAHEMKKGSRLAARTQQHAQRGKLGTGGKQGSSVGTVAVPGLENLDTAHMPRKRMEALIAELTEQMATAARDLQFEVAARLRDEIADLKREVRHMKEAGIE